MTRSQFIRAGGCAHCWPSDDDGDACPCLNSCGRYHLEDDPCHCPDIATVEP